jgi:hypothetical protein
VTSPGYRHDSSVCIDPMRMTCPQPQRAATGAVRRTTQATAGTRLEPVRPLACDKRKSRRLPRVSQVWTSGFGGCWRRRTRGAVAAGTSVALG